MSLLPILTYPDPRLYKVAAPVTNFDDSLRTLVRDMAATMYDAPGIGLAATQVNVHRQIIVIDVSDTRDDLKVFINPEITFSEGRAVNQEGCLSVPGIYDDIERAERITVRACDAHGTPFMLEATGLLAVCIQHEMDHLKGKVFVDYLSALKKTRIRAKMKKREREVRT